MTHKTTQQTQTPDAISKLVTRLLPGSIFQFLEHPDYDFRTGQMLQPTHTMWHLSLIDPKGRPWALIWDADDADAEAYITAVDKADADMESDPEPEWTAGDLRFLDCVIAFLTDLRDGMV